MNQENTRIKRALLSVSDKTGLVDFAHTLVAAGVEIISTGGTADVLRHAGIAVVDCSEVTEFPEMMDGRVKTLHPRIHGGILGLRDQHQAVAAEQGIGWIDLVVCNLYPFEATVKQSSVAFDQAVEQIDIGGPSMVRAAAKNMGWVTVIVDVADYARVTESLAAGISFEQRRQLAVKAFQHTAYYDALISEYFSQTAFPAEKTVPARQLMQLRYGENPHQAASVYSDPLYQGVSLLNAQQHQGKQLSYNNIADGDAALRCVAEFAQPACVIVKHANPCGVAVAASAEQAFQAAHQADSQSAFGGIVAFNTPVDESVAQALVSTFFEMIIAPDFSPAALRQLQEKPNLRVLALAGVPEPEAMTQLRSVRGGILIQEGDHHVVDESALQCVTKVQPSAEVMDHLCFAWRVVKHIKSNAILIAKDNVTLGIGPGQVSRVGAVAIALEKAQEGQASLQGAVLASDAFFPFRDSIDCLADAGISAVIQPGGSRRDDEVIAACDEHGIAMVLTGTRCFYH